jgi:hypothetical protein
VATSPRAIHRHDSRGYVRVRVDRYGSEGSNGAIAHSHNCTTTVSWIATFPGLAIRLGTLKLLGDRLRRG